MEISKENQKIRAVYKIVYSRDSLDF